MRPIIRKRMIMTALYMDTLSDLEVAILTHGDEECLLVVDNEAEWVVDTTTS